MPATAIDIVYTWVDGEDPVWRQTKREWMAQSGLDAGPSNEGSGDHTRYQNMREIVYAVRSVRRFAPWVRHTFVVLADGQRLPAELVGLAVPVPHSAIMPARILPTFSSYTIEAHLHRIPDLSEIFLYANDDFLFWRPTPQSFFVEDGRLRLRGRFLSRALAALGRFWRGHMRVATRTARMLHSRRLAAPFLPEHCIHVMRKATCEHAWDVFGEELSSATALRFRDDDRSIFWQLLVYSLESVLGAPRHVLSMNANVITFDAVERSLVARILVLLRLFFLRRFPPHTACFNTIPPSWHEAMHRYFEGYFGHQSLEAGEKPSPV